jgi:hypothetical protein
MNKFIETWLKRTLWLWLPFVAFKKLFGQVLEHLEERDTKNQL